MKAKPLSTRLRDERNRPPSGEPWIWLTRELIESEAWRSLSRAARLVIDRVMLEHMAHAGKENGKLIVTYDDFEEFAVRRSSLKSAIAECAQRGLIIVTQKGRASAGPNRYPSKYALGWLPMHDGSATNNRWKHWREKQLPSVRHLYTQNIESSNGGGTTGNGRTAGVPVPETSLASSNENAPDNHSFLGSLSGEGGTRENEFARLPRGWSYSVREKRLVTPDGTVVPLVDHPLVGNQKQRDALRQLLSHQPTRVRPSVKKAG